MKSNMILNIKEYKNEQNAVLTIISVDYDSVTNCIFSEKQEKDAIGMIFLRKIIGIRRIDKRSEKIR